MIRSSIQAKVINMIAEAAELEQNSITEKSQFNTDIILNSLTFAEMLMDCEEEFDIDIPMEDALNFKSVKDLVDYLHAKKAKSGGKVAKEEAWPSLWNFNVILSEVKRSWKISVILSNINSLDWGPTTPLRYAQDDAL